MIEEPIGTPLAEPVAADDLRSLHMPANTQTKDFKKMRVDQVGSLAPPLKLRAAFRRFKNAEISREDLTPFQDDAIREVIQAQEAIGFPIITDGEWWRGLEWRTVDSRQRNGDDREDAQQDSVKARPRDRVRHQLLHGGDVVDRGIRLDLSHYRANARDHRAGSIAGAYGI